MARVCALGHEKGGFPVLAHALPLSAVIDGAPFLVFLRGGMPNNDFRRGRIRLD
jgi:hypothetical protein